MSMETERPFNIVKLFDLTNLGAIATAISQI
jgi:hypothetical protein